MAEPFIGEIRSFGFTFAPVGWAQCNGQLLPISQFDALFAVVGTTYGGDGQTSFAVPNLQGQVPMHWGSNAGLSTTIGQFMGQSMVALTINQLPQHVHVLATAAVQTGTMTERSAKPVATSFISNAKGGFTFQPPPVTTNAPFSAKAISPAGGSQPHENMQPYLVLNFCMATEGIFPQRT
jgi:microcystin-dependent protein